MKIALTMSYDPGFAAVQLALTTAGSWNLTNPQVGLTRVVLLSLAASYDDYIYTNDYIYDDGL
jgi:hypothetical protein